MRKILRRAGADTLSYFGPRKEFLVAAPLIFLGTVVVSLYRTGGRAMTDALEATINGSIALVFVGFVLFVWNLACTPYRLERERAENAEREIARLRTVPTHADVPLGHLVAMQRYEGTVADLQSRLMALSALVAQYGRLRDASKGNNQAIGRGIDHEEIASIAELLMRTAEGLAPPLPHAPRNGLRVQIGWNHYLQILDVPMRIPPKIKITGIPDSAHYEVRNVTTISFEVHFWPDQIEVTTYDFTADARL